MSLQEKFQITVPPEPEKDDQWDKFPFEKSPNRTTGEAGFMHSNNVDSDAEANAKFNMLPPGMEIGNQRRKRFENMPLSLAGATDVAAGMSNADLTRGFSRREMKGTDDQYTGEHMDHFYGEAIDEEGNVGFVERNNYMDRE